MFIFLKGIIYENLCWMVQEAASREGPSTYNGYLLIDEMAIQQDLHIIKRGRNWSIVGAVDLGTICNSLEELSDCRNSTKFKLASHCLQYLYVGFNGFRWPVAYYGSDNVNGHALWFTFWDVVKHVERSKFRIHAAIMDGSSNNRQFTRIVVDPAVARMNKYTTTHLFDMSSRLSIIQDCKHVFKKIRNSMLSSTPFGKRQLSLNGQFIFWQYLQEAYEFNVKGEWKYFKRLTREHVYISCQGKMRNHLATEVLGYDMLDLMQKYKVHLKGEGYKLDSTLSLLENTSIFVSFFSNTKAKIYSVDDVRVTKGGWNSCVW